jgi:hypothetical protein
MKSCFISNALALEHIVVLKRSRVVSRCFVYVICQNHAYWLETYKYIDCKISYLHNVSKLPNPLY